MEYLADIVHCLRNLPVTSLGVQTLISMRCVTRAKIPMSMASKRD